MSKFSRPKKSSNMISDEMKETFHKEFSEVSGTKSDQTNFSLVNKKKKEKIKKISLNMREGDLKNSNNLRNKLIDLGKRDPLPTSTDIHRMGILYLTEATETKLQELFDTVIL